MDIHREIHTNSLQKSDVDSWMWKYSVKRNIDSANSLVVEPIDVKPLI